MTGSLVCQACDTLTMMSYCPKCDSPTIPYEPRGSGTLCVGPPTQRRGISVHSGFHGGDLHHDAGRVSTGRNSVCMSTSNRAPYEALARRISPSVDRKSATPEREAGEEHVREQLAKERELMIQCTSDILSITESFQLAQKKSIRVIDKLYQENQDLKQHAGMTRDNDPKGWRKRFGFSTAAATPPAEPPRGTPPLTSDPPRGGPRPHYQAGDDADDELLADIERRACAVEKELDTLLEGLGEAERLASEERSRLSARLESRGRSSTAASDARRPRLVSSYHQ